MKTNLREFGVVTYCPACGQSMPEIGGGYRCPVCKQSMP